MIITVLLGILFQEAQSIRYQIQRHQTIMDPIHDIHQVEYRVQMQFGSQKQPMELIIDTGSSDLWIPSIDAKGFLNNVNRYDCKGSSTCINTHSSYSVFYDDGPISGTLVWDQVWMHNIKFNQSFLLIERASGNMASSGGILGLGFNSNAANPNPSILESLYQQKLISKKYFSLYLKDEGEFGSYILFGGIDMEFIQKDQKISYVPLISDTSYLMGIEGMSIDDELFSITTALVDSGTSCLTVPAVAMDDMLQVFAAKGVECSYRVENYAPSYCTVHCFVNATNEQGIIDSFPIIKIRVNSSFELLLNPQDYLYSCTILDGSQSKCNTKLERSQSDDILLLGDAFLHSYYTVFDQTDKQMGFAHSINNKGLKLHVKTRHLVNFAQMLILYIALLLVI
ncbi:unnamed protein product (macronuclear) [Paramecium tetraurelia]|uniref:Peptidase A1 domain-containing protein n=1 Tax=Paramecium tetraurelia TaxID=5888 RepID=A0BF53_PARTE|nr:uncharacterized protein GSPATT00028205001 [Paramecium tetraurelia]CAK57170.1 unnamed protein product [Paramecium tetraurelia]|eukprot:XP_001424568.1 hypothetical protein (macronuclear) [Paramecium tetraurelia strain d4-2]